MTPSREGKDFAKVAHKLLQAELRSRGRGTITKVEDALGWNRRSIIKMRHDNLLRVADLVDILDQLGILPSTFIERVEAAMREGTVAPSGGGGGLGGLPRRSSRDDETSALLRDADELRYNDPVAALRAVSDLRPRVTRATAHLYYAVGGSCYRSLDLFEDAQACLKIAFEAAESENELATCHQRLAYTFLLREPEKGLSEVEKAYGTYERLQNEVGKSKALVDIAIFNRALGRLQQATDVANRALVSDELPRRYVVAAHQEVALVNLELGQQKQGLHQLRLALEAASIVTDRSTRANLLALAGWAFRSADFFGRSMNVFGEYFPFDSLTAGLDRCRLLDNREAQEETVRTLRAYCRHPAYQRFLDHVYAYIRMGRFTSHSFDFSGVRERWRDSQTQDLKIL